MKYLFEYLTENKNGQFIIIGYLLLKSEISSIYKLDLYNTYNKLKDWLSRNPHV